MSRHDIDFVTLNLAFEHDGETAVNDPLTKLLDHRLNIVGKRLSKAACSAGVLAEAIATTRSQQVRFIG